MSSKQSSIVHATAVSVHGHGILLTGLSGIGKSDLAIRMIDRGAKLISDDQVELRTRKNTIALYPAPNIAGKIEIRELGIFELDFVKNVPLKMTVELAEKTERFPLNRQTKAIMGSQIPSIKLVSNQPSAPIKVEMALQKLLRSEDQS